jgi:5'-phosphate synthase pdxT subunit
VDVSPSVPTVGVLALQGDVREHVAALTAAGASPLPVRRPAELAAVDGLVLPGGESTTMEKLLRVFDLFEPLRARIAEGLPVYGSCAGMILIADRVAGATADQTTLGGIDMTVRRNAFGRQVDSHEQYLTAPALGAGEGEPPLHAVFIRAPWVEQVGAGVEVLARAAAPAGGGADGKIVAVRQGRLLATAFHPEIGGEMRVHRLFVEMVSDARLPSTQQLTS